MLIQPQAGARANCERCGIALQVAAARSEESAPFRRADVPKGFCADCVFTQFLYNTYPINMQLDRSGPQVLLHPEMRQAILLCGLLNRCDMNVDELDWQRIVDNWDLPVACEPSATNPYRMGDHRREREAMRLLEEGVAAGAEITRLMLEAAGCSSDAARRAVEADATRFITPLGTFTARELTHRRSLRHIIEDCRFCRGRGCLSCETEEREARRAAERRATESLVIDGRQPEADQDGIIRCTNAVM